MSTAQTIINRALRLIGAVASGDSPSGDESADALNVLNSVLEWYRNEPNMAWTVDDVSGTISGGTSSYTLGPSGDINTTRPVIIDNARLTFNGIDYPLEIINQTQWAQIRVKTAISSNIPLWIYTTGDYPQITLYLWPVPTVSGTLTLGVRHPFAALSALTDTISWPPGYEEAAAYDLAFRLAPEYEKTLSPAFLNTRTTILNAIKRTNFEVPLMRNDMGTGRYYNIYADQ